MIVSFLVVLALCIGVLGTNLQIVLYDSGLSICDRVNERSTLNKPLARQCKIINELQRWILADNVMARWEPILKPDESVIDSLLSIHKSSYLNFLLNCWSSHVKDGSEPEVSTAEGLIPLLIARRDECEYYNPDVNDVHHEWRQMGWFADDNTTPINDDTGQIILQDLAVVKHAANLMVQVESSTQFVIVASTTFPGHHAGYDRYSGYSFVNHALFAAATILQESLEARVAVIDLDYHYGNGARSIMRHLKLDHPTLAARLTAVSLHADPRMDYPVYTGFAQESTQHEWNVPLKPGTTVQEYIDALRSVLPSLHKITHLILAFGTDTVINDPSTSKIGGFALQVDDYSAIFSTIRSAIKDVPIMITSEGGYDLNATPLIWKNAIAALL